MNPVSEHRLHNNLAETRRIGAWVAEFAQAHQWPAAVQNAVDHSLVEWVTNIISYAFEDAREHAILIRFIARPGEACVEVEDDGRAFNPLTLPPADTSAPLEERAIGGLGIHMMRKLMDAVEYRREGMRNIVTMSKSAAGKK